MPMYDTIHYPVEWPGYLPVRRSPINTGQQVEPWLVVAGNGNPSAPQPDNEMPAALVALMIMGAGALLALLVERANEQRKEERRASLPKPGRPKIRAKRAPSSIGKP